MSDGNNEYRARRVFEIATEYGNLQLYITQMIQSANGNTDKTEQAYVIQRSCIAEGHALLSAPFDSSALQMSGSVSPEAARMQFQRIMTDISLRRFRAQRIILLLTAATRWINDHHASCAGQGRIMPDGHRMTPPEADQQLARELASINNEQILNNLRLKDYNAGCWISEDPSPSDLLARLRSQ